MRAHMGFSQVFLSPGELGFGLTLGTGLTIRSFINCRFISVVMLTAQAEMNLEELAWQAVNVAVNCQGGVNNYCCRVLTWLLNQFIPVQFPFAIRSISAKNHVAKNVQDDNNAKQLNSNSLAAGINAVSTAV